ncbi:MAG: DUF89 family protein, partial [Candidatus Aminicenantes bacterium]|nr:DUF89 family protein [Candidatus Aminicenantes bacterium]
MKAYLDCYSCFFNQALKTSRMITSDEKKIWKILNEVSLSIPKIPFGATPAEIGREVYRIISEQTGVEDPYKKIKEKNTQQALSLYPELKKLINSSNERLKTAVRLSIAGNVIDFGANTDFDLPRDIETILSQDFSINHYQEFCEVLDNAKNVLYLADNAGETVFDRILIEELHKPVIYAVREKPIINDATREDALLAGIDEVSEILSSGCDAPGSILKFCSDEFLEVYRSADLIISKGQGNYEALSDEERPIFFLLKAKCRVVARDIGVEEGSIILASSRG